MAVVEIGIGFQMIWKCGACGWWTTDTVVDAGEVLERAADHQRGCGHVGLASIPIISSRTLIA